MKHALPGKREAEIRWCCLVVHKNLALNVVNDLIPTAAACYPDSRIAASVRLGRTKATQLVKSIGTYQMEETFKDLQGRPLNIITDETTDKGVVKQVTLVLRYAIFRRLTLVKTNSRICDPEMGRVSRIRVGAGLVNKSFKSE